MTETKTRRTRVYVAGPITLGDQTANIRTAIQVTDKLLSLGYAPYCPHLSHFQQLMFPRSYEDWMSLDFEWLPLCDALLRLPGKSAGADREVAFARELDISVFFHPSQLTTTIPPELPFAPAETVDERKRDDGPLIGRRVASSIRRRRYPNRRDAESKGRRNENHGRTARGTEA